jgi:hypothetical protein
MGRVLAAAVTATAMRVIQRAFTYTLDVTRRRGKGRGKKERDQQEQQQEHRCYNMRISVT